MHWYDDVKELAHFYSALEKQSSSNKSDHLNISTLAAGSFERRPLSSPLLRRLPIAPAVIWPSIELDGNSNYTAAPSPQQGHTNIRMSSLGSPDSLENEDQDQEQTERQPQHPIKIEESIEIMGDEGDEDIIASAPPQPSMQPVPTAPPRAMSPDEQSQQGPGRHGRRHEQHHSIPIFFQNNGLVLTNTEGHLPTNEASLPTEKSFTIQVGPEQFRLSGASINSDAPSYFSRFFESELSKRNANDVPANEPIRTLYVDRDPATFRDIALHLQGYHIQPRDSTHYVRLFADAQFYVLPRLIKHLYESDVFIRIGEDEFCVPRDLFELEPGNTPNYFTLGFSLLFSTPGNPFPGLDVSGLLRPPAIKAASASGRSGRIFADILDLLRGYDVPIRNEAHRQALLRDCRYYHLRGVEQKIIPLSLGWNDGRKTSEIVIRIEDLRQSGLIIDQFSEPSSLGSSKDAGASRIHVLRYARPFVDDTESPHELIIETGTDSATIRPGNNFVVEFHAGARQRIMSLFKVVARKYATILAARGLIPVPQLTSSRGGDNDADSASNLPNVPIVNQDGQAVARIEPDAAVTIDGKEGWLIHPSVEGRRARDKAATETDSEDNDNDEDDDGPDQSSGTAKNRTKKRKRLNTGEPSSIRPEEDPAPHEWTVMHAQWRVRVESWGRSGVGNQDRSIAVHLYAVKLDLVKGQRGRNRRRAFLDGS